MTRVILRARPESRLLDAVASGILQGFQAAAFWHVLTAGNVEREAPIVYCTLIETLFVVCPSTVQFTVTTAAPRSDIGSSRLI